MTGRRAFLNLLIAVVLLNCMWSRPTVKAAEHGASRDGVMVVGFVVELTEKWILVKAVDEDEPVKYLIDAANREVISALSGVTISNRVRLTYTSSGGSKHLASIDPSSGRTAGSVTGVVTKHYGWWIIVKPQQGVTEGYGLFDHENKDVMEKLKASKEGDSVTIAFVTTIDHLHHIRSLDNNTTLAEKDEGKIAGILIDKKDNWITVKADGEDEPVRYVLDAPDKKLAEAFKVVFNACRVQLTYKQAGDSRQLVSIKRQILKADGTVTGEVVKVYNDFWVEVKPENGLADAYAPGANYSDKDFMAKLRGLQEGDSVTIRFTTDFERHRIISLRKKPIRYRK